MAKSKPAPVEDEPTEIEADASTWERAPLWLRSFGVMFVLAVLLVSSFEIVYAGKIFPGIMADGIDIGGLSRSAAKARLAGKITDFSGQVVTISNGDTNLRIPVASLNVTYDTTRATDLAFEYGRQGSWLDKARRQLRTLLGRDTNFAVYSYDDAHLVPYITQLADDLITPVSDASLSFDSGRPIVNPAKSGTRLDLGQLTSLVSGRLSQMSIDPVRAPVYQLVPMLGTDSLSAVTNQLGGYLAGPISLSYSGTELTVDQKTIISWIQVGSKPVKPFLTTLNLEGLYPPPPSADVNLDKTAVAKYVAGLAGNIDQTPVNAALDMQNGQLTVIQPSRTGIKLDQTDAVNSITKSLSRPATDREVALKLDITQADVNENNLSSLGITDQLSEGETYFPGSPSTRLTNVRSGASKFNGVLLKPGQVFSFGALLGSVGPETGYVPELVIIGDHEEYQYGGGLCQVSTTAFRAALLAGLPINERVNHAFAISYYTWPYGVPGVDATIYYPQVDFKFTNDTGHYILIQTVMNGVDLKFDFFGTKTKTGAIRGPQFVSGSSDAKQPSHTVFYRDILDLAGNVTKTDTFQTYYQPSTNFPITKQFN